LQNPQQNSRSPGKAAQNKVTSKTALRAGTPPKPQCNKKAAKARAKARAKEEAEAKARAKEEAEAKAASRFWRCVSAKREKKPNLIFS
jgi:hypothetical protein